MGQFLRHLQSIGLTNSDSPSYGDLASAKLSLIKIALCSCGYETQLPKEDNCPSCRKALFWESVPKARIEFKLRQQKRKLARRLVIQTLNNLMRREVTAGQLLGTRFWNDKTTPDTEDVPVSAISPKLIKELSIESLAYDFLTKSVVIYQKNGKEKRYQIGNPYLEELAREEAEKQKK